MTSVKLIRDWSVECCAGQEFQAPERRDHIHLAGEVEGRNGRVLTSRIAKTEGREVTTASGSVYRLGRPAPKFLAWLRERGKAYDRKQPVKVPRAPVVSRG